MFAAGRQRPAPTDPSSVSWLVTCIAVATAAAAVAAFVGTLILVWLSRAPAPPRETYDDSSEGTNEAATEVRLVSRKAFARAALASPHLMPRGGGGGGWATTADARARGHATLEAARAAYADGAIDVFDEEEEDEEDDSETQLPSASRRAQRELRAGPPRALRTLFLCAREADRACRAAGYAFLADIPWKIAVLRDDIEAGLPHTVSDIVCLPRALAVMEEEEADAATRRRVMSTLVHEKVHVYQRLRPTDVHRFVREELGCARFLDISSLSSTWPSPPAPAILGDLLERTRSNPDLDGWLYACSPPRTTAATTGSASTGTTTTLTVYAHEPPSSILDTRRVVLILDDEGGNVIDIDADDVEPGPHREHPYETMAYALQSRIARDTAPKAADAAATPRSRMSMDETEEWR